MRFMLIAKATRDSEQGVPPKPELMAAIGQFGQEIEKRGKVVDHGGLLPSALGARVRTAGGRMTVTDGPFTDGRDLVAGYAIVDVPTREDAIALSKAFLQLHVDAYGTGYEGESEVRQMFEMPAGA